MTAPIVIIGSGFAAYQLVKNIRRQDADVGIMVITADEGDEYNKPDLSHVFSKQQSADALIQLTGAAFAEQYKLTLLAHTRVERIDPQGQCVYAEGDCYHYSKLVLATGAKAFVPPTGGNASEHIITLNSLAEYRQSQDVIQASSKVLIMGGGLIGIELAMDLQASGKSVVVIEPNSRILANVTPDFVALKLEQQLQAGGLTLVLNDLVESINQSSVESTNQSLVESTKQSYSQHTDKNQLLVTTKAGQCFEADCVISAAGLRPNTQLAVQTGIEVNRGIKVNNQLMTSAEHVYALGDCAEINGQVMAYLQPIVLSANVLAKQVLGQASELRLPAMMVKVKTPTYPIQVGGQFGQSSAWKVDFDQQGIVAQAFDQESNMTGFVVTNDNVNQAFSLLRKVS